LKFQAPIIFSVRNQIIATLRHFAIARSSTFQSTYTCRRSFMRRVNNTKSLMFVVGCRLESSYGTGKVSCWRCVYYDASALIRCRACYVYSRHLREAAFIVCGARQLTAAAALHSTSRVV